MISANFSDQKKRQQVLGYVQAPGGFTIEVLASLP